MPRTSLRSVTERALRARWNQNISRNRKTTIGGDPIRHPFDCIDSGKDAENFAALRYRTGTARPLESKHQP